MDSPPASLPRRSPRPRPSARPSPRTPPSQSRPARPPESADAERRYPMRSTRAAVRPKHPGRPLASPAAAQPRLYEAAESTETARRYPLRSNRAATSSSQRVRTLELASPPPSVLPTPDPHPCRKPPSDDATDQGSYETASEDTDRLIKIQMDELHSALDTLGVSVEERKGIINTVSRKCMAVYDEAVRYEKDRCLTLVKAISDLENQLAELSSVLGEIEVVPDDFLKSASLREIHQSLKTQVMRLNVFRKCRLQNLQRMNPKITELWDHLGVTLEEQKEFRYMMRNTTASSEKVTEKGSLSPDILNKIKAELRRLEGQLMQEVAKKFAVLADNLKQTHLTGDKDYQLKFTLMDVRDGKIDMFSADSALEDLIMKSRRDILLRADIVARAAAFFSSPKESSSHGEAKMKSLIDRVTDWEIKNVKSFVYDKQLLITELLVPEKDNHLDVVSGEEAAEKPHPSTWSEDSEGSKSDDDSDDPEFVASSSDEEL